MTIKIRLARFGRRNAPFYNIVVAQARYAQILGGIHVLLRQVHSDPNRETSKLTT